MTKNVRLVAEAVWVDKENKFTFLVLRATFAKVVHYGPLTNL